MTAGSYEESSRQILLMLLRHPDLDLDAVQKDWRGNDISEGITIREFVRRVRPEVVTTVEAMALEQNTTQGLKTGRSRRL